MLTWKSTQSRFAAPFPRMRDYGVQIWMPFNEGLYTTRVLDHVSGRHIIGDVAQSLVHTGRFRPNAGTGGVAFGRNGFGSALGTWPWNSGYTVLTTCFRLGSVAGSPAWYFGVDSGVNRHFYQNQNSGGTSANIRVYDGSWNAIIWQPGNTDDFDIADKINMAFVFEGLSTGLLRGYAQVVTGPSNFGALQTGKVLTTEVQLSTTNDLSGDFAFSTRTNTNAASGDCEADELVVLAKPFTESEALEWLRDPGGFWQPPRRYLPFVAAAPSEDHTVNLPTLKLDTDTAAPDVTATLTNEINVPAPQLDTDPQTPEVDVPILLQVFLDRAVEIDTNPQPPGVVAKEDITVNLPTLDLRTEPVYPSVNVGGEQIVTLEAAVELDVDPIAPVVFAELTNEINVPAALLDIEPAVGNIEGVSELPPSIDIPTANQIYTYGQSGVLPAPVHTVGTGDNPTWTLPVDGFGSQPGVMTWSVNSTTGDITYQINQLSSDPDEQALNTKGPYSVTRRITTTVGDADEVFEVAVNIGNRTLQMTPGTKPCYTWNTRTAAARGVEPGQDPSARITQTYTVT